MKNKTELVKSITNTLETDSVTKIDTIKHRKCSSENYDGISITITGDRIQIRPILESVAPFDEWRVENIGMYNDIPDDDNGYEYGITMFCAYCEQNYDNNIFT